MDHKSQLRAGVHRRSLVLRWESGVLGFWATNLLERYSEDRVRARAAGIHISGCCDTVLAADAQYVHHGVRIVGLHFMLALC